MGSYIYGRRKRVIECVDPRCPINIYVYLTKPYWNIWDDAQMTDRYGEYAHRDYWDSHERYWIGKYRRMITTTANARAALLQAGKLSRLVIEMNDDDKINVQSLEGTPVYWEERPAARMVDDNWHGNAGKKCGVLHHTRQGWTVIFDPGFSVDLTRIIVDPQTEN